jgi:hypothetical protein
MTLIPSLVKIGKLIQGFKWWGYAYTREWRSPNLLPSTQASRRCNCMSLNEHSSYKECIHSELLNNDTTLEIPQIQVLYNKGPSKIFWGIQMGWMFVIVETRYI